MRSFLLIAIMLAACATTTRTPLTRPESRDDLAYRRSLQIQRLHDYRIAAVFPVDTRGLPWSVFRDYQNRPCPMAFLIEKSGHRDLVNDVATTNNTLRLADVHDGPLLEWMLTSGLTQEEVAMVQGAMTIDGIDSIPADQVLPYVTPEEQLWARQQVIRKLEIIELALQAQTRRSLNVAETRLLNPVGPPDGARDLQARAASSPRQSEPLAEARTDRGGPSAAAP
jgi:hypothetical protein